MKTYDSFESREKFNKIKRMVCSFDGKIPEFMEYNKEDMLYCIDSEIDHMERFLEMYKNLRKEVEEQKEI